MLFGLFFNTYLSGPRVEREGPPVKFVELSINHIVGLVHKHHIMNEIQNKHVQRTCLMYHAASKVEF